MTRICRPSTDKGKCAVWGGYRATITGQGSVAPAPFSYEQDAVDTRNAIDYTIKISLDDARAGKVPRAVRVYADGIYDMFHTGHARQLMQAKMAFPNAYLIVGICSDKMTLTNKGRTVMNETERYEAVRHCRYVDEVVTDAPWTLDPVFLEKHKIDFVAHDELPYTTGSPDADVYKFVKEKGMFLPTQRTEGISTTDVITRIIKDYDLYIRRNLARGYSHKELNVSYMKAKHLKLKDNYEKFEEKLKDKGKNWMGKWKDQLGKGNEMLHRWEEKSKEFIGNFVEMFGRDGRLDGHGIIQNFFEHFPWQGRVGQWFQENTQRIGRAISPSTSPLPFSPPSPSTSDPSSPSYSSPPQKRRRYTPPLLGLDEDDSDEDEDDDDDDDDFLEGAMGEVENL
ncbi:choline-phosphate cytidylyltransferase [Elysia marginata]|uniref:choline-phosphate cytidylyltransferase n=1 Tax=Elysia marginata TaxID=1093978 RepID=A0AAV4F6X4_9GAST|nr:choline-phosphate cytidylyltransferase [Elysia marginata]